MEEVGALTAEIVRFVRAFGLHRPDDTPCGAGVSVSEAHALAVLATAPPMTQGKLAAELCLTKSTISRLVDQLASAVGSRLAPAIPTAGAESCR
jgi:DNA-binding MarR family transcriptional regulator